MSDVEAYPLQWPLAVVERHRRTPDMGTVRIPLSSRKFPNLYALIDEQDAELVAPYPWHVLRSRRCMYAVTNVYRDGGRTYLYMHRLILGIVQMPDRQGDHINHDGLDNRRQNLRIVSNQFNHFNERSSVSGSSLFKGVSWHRKAGKWSAHIKKHGKKYHLGLYSSEIEAARAYDDAAQEMFGAFASLNFPERLAS